jgi:hypothetical protein
MPKENNRYLQMPVPIGRSSFLPGQSAENELLLFFKPECFQNEMIHPDIAEIVAANLKAFGCVLGSPLFTTGDELARTDCIGKHYKVINFYSIKGAAALNSADRAQIFATVKESDTTSNMRVLKIMGGHEYLVSHPELSAAQLDAIWCSGTTFKLKSGCYFQLISCDKDRGQAVIVLNGFHPHQLNHYTEPENQLCVHVTRSNRSWRDLRRSMLGATNTIVVASKGSIRNLLFVRAKERALGNASIADNFVHLSAGPFEALSEIYNFSRLLLRPIDISQTLLGQRLLSCGYDVPLIERLATNPETTTGSLFDITEEFDTTPALALLRTLQWSSG